MAGKFIIKKASNGEYYFRLQAGNGETILSSERYSTKASAENGIASVKENAPNDARYERKTSASGKDMFNLKAANHQIIGTSETYSSAAARDNGIASVKSNAPGASIDDQS
ncbi:YegP family protein [Reyranella sp. CPCC 100927]|uniref:YegP family protein n=1 Tax=Reyranella sp. CPCC 100927 TaxID=2599616 RepID=UPI0011B74B60|nr:DUF1508 domain-containing protein [Reyranella sp. CPCC 100927]